MTIIPADTGFKPTLQINSLAELENFAHCHFFASTPSSDYTKRTFKFVTNFQLNNWSLFRIRQAVNHGTLHVATPEGATT